MAEDVEFDKNKGLREIILFKVRESSNDLAKLYYNDPHQRFDHENKYCLCFCICLEQCLTWGLKTSTFFMQRSFYDFLRKGIDACGDPGLRSSFETANALLLSKDGKTRAWIRLCLNQGTLAENLYALAANRRFVTSWYDPWSIISTNALNDLHEMLQSLSQITFEFKLRDRTLDKSSLFEKGPEHFRAIHNLKPVIKNAEPKKPKKKPKRKKPKKRRIELDIPAKPVAIIEPLEEKIEEQQKSDSDDEIFEEEFEPTPDPIKNNENDVVTNIDEITNTILECVDASNLDNEEPTNNDKFPLEKQIITEETIMEAPTIMEEKNTMNEANDNLVAHEPQKKEHIPVKKVVPQKILIKEKERSPTSETNFLATKQHPIRRSSSAIQVMRTSRKPVYNKHRSMSASKPSTILPKIQADEVQFKPQVSAIKRESNTPIETLTKYNFPKSGEYSRDEEKFEEKLLAEQYEKEENKKVFGDIDTSVIITRPEELSMPVECPQTPQFEELTAPFFGAEPEITIAAPEVRDRGITMQQGLEDEFERKIFGVIPVMSLEGDYFAQNNKERDRRMEEQIVSRKHRRLEEQDFLRDQNRTSSNIENVLPSTGLILISPPKSSKRAILRDQNSRCFGCDSLIDTSYCSKCNYTGKLYCNECLDGESNFYIPHFLLSELDCKKYVVSSKSLKHLSSMYSVPAIPLSQLNPKQVQNEDRLKAVSQFLIQLSIAREHVYSSEYRQLVVQKLDSRAYLLDSFASDRDSFPQNNSDCCGVISMKDFIEIFFGNFLQELKTAIYVILQTLQECDPDTWQKLRQALGS